MRDRSWLELPPCVTGPGSIAPCCPFLRVWKRPGGNGGIQAWAGRFWTIPLGPCLLYTTDVADELTRVTPGGCTPTTRRIQTTQLLKCNQQSPKIHSVLLSGLHCVVIVSARALGPHESARVVSSAASVGYQCAAVGCTGTVGSIQRISS